MGPKVHAHARNAVARRSEGRGTASAYTLRAVRSIGL